MNLVKANLDTVTKHLWLFHLAFVPKNMYRNVEMSKAAEFISLA
jgi:hypothetical protein